MKKLFELLGNLLYVGLVIWEIIEFLALPALFVLIGLLNSYSWQYYAITIGGYIVIIFIAEIIAHLTFRAVNKKYTPLLQRKFEKLFDKFFDKN